MECRRFGMEEKMLSKKDRQVRISTLLGRYSEIQGDFTVKGSARIDGRINGNVSSDGTLIVGASGSINGNVTADAVMVGGEILGDIQAPGKVELTSTAKVLGDITTNLIVIDENAVFQGKCDMNQTEPDRKARAKAVKAGKKSAKAAIEEALKEVEEEANREAAAQEESMLSQRMSGENDSLL